MSVHTEVFGGHGGRSADGKRRAEAFGSKRRGGKGVLGLYDTFGDWSMRGRRYFQPVRGGAKTRLTLQKLLDLPNIKIHFMYQASEVSKGDQSFHEYQWLETESCLVKD